MGVTPAISNDPRRWNADIAEERRWEDVFARFRLQKQEFGKNFDVLDGRLTDLQRTLDARPNATAGETDRVLTLAGSRGVRGTRTQAVELAEDAFTEWTTVITFAAPFATPPVVTLTPEVGTVPVQAMVRNVTTTDFTVWLVSPTAVTSMTVHFQAWGDS